MMGGLELGMFGIGALIMIAFWVLVIGGAAWLVVTLARGASTGAQHTSTGAPSAAGQAPLAILQARYAKGEITKEQFDEMKRDLGG